MNKKIKPILSFEGSIIPHYCDMINDENNIT